ncbi:hypothetical protein QJQ45_011957 [Haematococcus lacustris]|nr:hypothetical protein QJQ45_011957 [Haematococcus lacustris]
MRGQRPSQPMRGQPSLVKRVTTAQPPNQQPAAAATAAAPVSAHVNVSSMKLVKSANSSMKFKTSVSRQLSGKEGRYGFIQPLDDHEAGKRSPESQHADSTASVLNAAAYLIQKLPEALKRKNGSDAGELQEDVGAALGCPAHCTLHACMHSHLLLLYPDVVTEDGRGCFNFME